ncbi:MAG: efflux RND transporter periplasmic adaptor subunit [Rikenellaceae bacterium]
MKQSKLLILALTLSIISCTRVENNTNQTPRCVKYELAQTASDNLSHSTFTGKVAACEDVNLGFRVAGIIDNINVKDGDKVKCGDILASLDERDYKVQLSATEAEYDAVYGEVTRIKALYQTKSVSENDYNKAINTLKAITAKKLSHQNALSDTKLRAPFEGIIQKTNFDKGEAVAAGTPVVSMISSSCMEISVDIPAKYFLMQDNYLSATAKVDLLKDNTYSLKLIGASPKANLNQLHKLTFQIEPSNQKLPSPGMSATVEIKYAPSASENIMISFSSVFTKEDKTYVWIIDNNNKVAEREVKIEEICKNGYAIISSGLAVDEKIVSAGINSLKSGQSVSLLQSASTSNIGAIK